MAIFAVLLLALSGCTQFDIFLEAATDEGTVYDCRTADGRELELCYLDDSAAELGEQVGGVCSTTSRTWPALTNFLHIGCDYHCPHGPVGANAKNGAYCP